MGGGLCRLLCAGSPADGGVGRVDGEGSSLVASVVDPERGCGGLPHPKRRDRWASASGRSEVETVTKKRSAALVGAGSCRLEAAAFEEPARRVVISVDALHLEAAPA